jgi:hypothetical protein
MLDAFEHGGGFGGVTAQNADVGVVDFFLRFASAST